MRLIKLCTLILAATLLCSASTIQFLGPNTGANNGSVYVGPYDLTFNGIPILGTCVTFDIEITDGETWNATVDTITDFSASNQTLYLEAEYLNQQFNVSPDWSGIHQAIWDIFETGIYTDSDTLNWLTSAETHYSSVNPISFEVLVPDPVDAAQTFLIASPEPFTFILIGSGLLLLGFSKRKV